MKVLSLIDFQQDYLAEMLVKGLIQTLGNENIILYPYCLRFRGGTDNEYLLPDGSTGNTACPQYLKPEPDNEWSFEEICSRINEFDFIWLSSARDYAIQGIEKLRNALGAENLPPVVFSDGEDSDQIRYDVIEKYKPIAVFKRELVNPVEGVYPLPFASFAEDYPVIDDTKKEYKVFALFGRTCQLRVQLVDFLLKLNLPNSYIGIDTGAVPWQDPDRLKYEPLLPYEEYLKRMAQSEIAFVIRGHGRDSVRRFESPAFETCVFECDCGVITPYPFEDGVHRVGFKADFSDIERKLDYYLSHDEERRQIAKVGKEHLFAYHTTRKRADYFLKIVEGKIEGRKNG